MGFEVLQAYASKMEKLGKLILIFRSEFCILSKVAVPQNGIYFIGFNLLRLGLYEHLYLRAISPTPQTWENIKIKSDFISSSMPGASLRTHKERGRKTAHKVYVTTEKSSNCAERNIYLNPFFGSVFLSSCMLLKQKKPLRT